MILDTVFYPCYQCLILVLTHIPIVIVLMILLIFLCELCTIIVNSHLTSVILTDTFTSIMTISTSLVLPVYGYTENKEMNE